MRRRGAGKKFFGSVLLGLGFLNALLGLKAGHVPGIFLLALFLGGGALVLAGVYEARNRES